MPLQFLRTIFLVLTLVLGACSQNEVRITEYKGEGSYLFWVSGNVGGVRVTSKGVIDGCLIYIKDDIYYELGCKEE